MLIDIHSHINFKDFKEDADAVIRRAFDNDIWQIVVGSELKTSQRALEYAKKYDSGVYAAVGLQPFHTWDQDIDAGEYQIKTKQQLFSENDYLPLIKDKKVVAMGEIGLDYYRLEGPDQDKIVAAQKTAFEEQLVFANKHDLPCIIHCRQAHEDVLAILKHLKESDDMPKVVMHSFVGNFEQAQQYIDLGCFMSFNGLITFARDWDKTIKWLPLDRIMVETDCPWLTPVPHRGKRNEPSYVKYVAEKLAELKDVSFDEVAQTTTNTAKDFFNLAVAR